MFFNTGISTYVWILSIKKEAERAGKVQLTGMKKSLGSACKQLGDDDIERIVDSENISVKVNVYRYLAGQVAVHLPDAWMDRSKDKIGFVYIRVDSLDRWRSLTTDVKY